MSFRRLRCWGFIISFLSIFFIFIISTCLEPLIKPFIFLIDNTHLSASDLITISSVFAALGLTLTSISYSAGEWYNFFEKFRNLGIFDGRPNRKGRSAERAVEWMDEIKISKHRVILSGTTLSGWFDRSWDDLLTHLPDILNKVTSFKIFLLNPSSQFFSVRQLDETVAEESDNDTISARSVRAYNNIESLYTDPVLFPYIQKGLLSIAFYDGTPLPLVLIDKKLHFTPYLTFVQNSECPELLMNDGELFSNQFMRSLERIENHHTTRYCKTKGEFHDIINNVNRRN